ncbi:MAG TPA: NTP transferase domain-containing protein [Geothrix sp.]|nr:NTP transferase domain-containing protein [Geothrix sp.]
MLLLTGGRGSRMGTPKHNLPHPAGTTWGGYLIDVFQAVFPGAPVQVLGDPIQDRPDLPVVEDPREGPAAALRAWAQAPSPVVDLWWVVGCDQVRWRAEDLRDWFASAKALDPQHERWVLARCEGVAQPLGGWLPQALRPAFGLIPGASLRSLVEALPHLLVDSALEGWRDVDTREEREAFQRRMGEAPSPRRS